jgi:hypothetical protein
MDGIRNSPPGLRAGLASIYNDQLYFTYGDDNSILHDVWYDS